MYSGQCCVSARLAPSDQCPVLALAAAGFNCSCAANVCTTAAGVHWISCLMRAVIQPSAQSYEFVQKKPVQPTNPQRSSFRTSEPEPFFSFLSGGNNSATHRTGRFVVNSMDRYRQTRVWVSIQCQVKWGSKHLAGRGWPPIPIAASVKTRKHCSKRVGSRPIKPLAHLVGIAPTVNLWLRQFRIGTWGSVARISSRWLCNQLILEQSRRAMTPCRMQALAVVASLDEWRPRCSGHAPSSRTYWRIFLRP